MPKLAPVVFVCRFLACSLIGVLLECSVRVQWRRVVSCGCEWAAILAVALGLEPVWRACAERKRWVERRCLFGMPLIQGVLGGKQFPKKEATGAQDAEVRPSPRRSIRRRPSTRRLLRRWVPLQLHSSVSAFFCVLVALKR